LFGKFLTMANGKEVIAYESMVLFLLR